MNLIGARIKSLNDQLEFVLGGNAYFTVLNNQTGNRYTYRVTENKRESEVTHWVCVLVGPENMSDYKFMGYIKGGEFYNSQKGGIGPDAQSVKVFSWFYKHLKAKDVPLNIEFWHIGRCGVCGKPLTVPESIARGVGPICVGRIS